MLTMRTWPIRAQTRLMLGDAAECGGDFALALVWLPSSTKLGHDWPTLPMCGASLNEAAVSRASVELFIG